MGQYVEFCRIADVQRQLYGLTRQAIQETIRICLERDILVLFLTIKQEEVVDIMDFLFSQEEIWEMDRQDARQEGFQKSAEMIKKLVTQGRVSDLLAIAADTNKFSELAREFGLE